MTKARNVAHAHTGTVTTGLRPAAGPVLSVDRFGLRQQSCLV
jgi:hypothetical protein